MRKKLDSILTSNELDGLVRLREAFHERGEILLVLELMHGDLNQIGIGWEDVVQILKDVLETLCGLHKKGFVHFDVRPGENNQKIFYLERTAKPTRLRKRVWDSENRKLIKTGTRQ